MIGVAVFGLGFWQAALALILGSAFSGLVRGVLWIRSPVYGVPQMVLSRLRVRGTGATRSPPG